MQPVFVFGNAKEAHGLNATVIDYRQPFVNAASTPFRSTDNCLTIIVHVRVERMPLHRFTRLESLLDYIYAIEQ